MFFGQITEKIFCAFCKIERRVYVKKHIGLINIILAALASVALMFGIWAEFDSRVFMIFSVFICVAEMFILLRWRLSVRCPYCSFDPVLYIKNRKQLIENIKETLEKRKSSPGYLLSRKNPLLNLSKRPLSGPITNVKPDLVLNDQLREHNVSRPKSSSHYSDL